MAKDYIFQKKQLTWKDNGATFFKFWKNKIETVSIEIYPVKNYFQNKDK